MTDPVTTFGRSVPAAQPGLLAATLALAMSVTACAPITPPAIAASPTGAPSASYRVDSGDRLRITVFRHLDLSGEFVIDGGGNLALPLIGVIQGGSLTPRELESVIEVAFKEGGYLVDPQVGVEILSYRPFYILGEVNQPGSYPYVNGMTVITAVALAGGFTARASQSSITISRGNYSTRQSIDLASEILPGDILTIEERFF